MPREGSHTYLRELLRQAEDAFASATDDKQSAVTLPIVLNLCRNLLALVERLESQLKFAQASILEIENSLAPSKPQEEPNVVDETDQEV